MIDGLATLLGLVGPLTVGAAGAVVSITSVLFEPSECAAPGLASVSVPLFPARSLIVPPLRASALVEA